MPLASTSQLAALVLAGLQTTAPAAPCGCAQFALDAGSVRSDDAKLSVSARTLRDFILFSHRRIGADLIHKHGPYLDTLSAFFPHCANDAVKLAWLRQTLAGVADTRLFAERIAQQYDSGHACTIAAQ